MSDIRSLRVIWRDREGQRRATHIPIPEDASAQFLAGLADAFPPFTAYTHDDTEQRLREIERAIFEEKK
jgi:hypothetical protein